MTNKELETMFDLTAHEGWTLLMKDVEEKIESYKEALSYPGEVKPYDQGTAHGHLFVYRELKGLRDALRNALETKEDQEHEDE